MLSIDPACLACRYSLLIPWAPAAGHCHFQDSRLMGGLRSPVRSHLQLSMGTYHGSRTVTIHLVEFQWGQSYQTSQMPSNTTLRHHNTASWLDAYVHRINWWAIYSSKTNMSNADETEKPPLGQRQTSSSLRSSWGPGRSGGGCLCSGAQHSFPVTTNMRFCRQDLYNASAHRGRSHRMLLTEY